MAALTLVAMAGAPGSARGSHGAIADGIVLEGATLRRVTTALENRCAVTGTVRNTSRQTLTVRIWYRGLDAAGHDVAFAMARVPRLEPGEQREYQTAPFFPSGNPTALYPCSRLQGIELIQAAGDPPG